MSNSSTGNGRDGSAVAPIAVSIASSTVTDIPNVHTSKKEKDKHSNSVGSKGQGSNFSVYNNYSHATAGMPPLVLSSGHAVLRGGSINVGSEQDFKF